VIARVEYAGTVEQVLRFAYGREGFASYTRPRTSRMEGGIDLSDPGGMSAMEKNGEAAMIRRIVERELAPPDRFYIWARYTVEGRSPILDGRRTTSTAMVAGEAMRRVPCNALFAMDVCRGFFRCGRMDQSIREWSRDLRQSRNTLSDQRHLIRDHLFERLEDVEAYLEVLPAFDQTRERR